MIKNLHARCPKIFTALTIAIFFVKGLFLPLSASATEKLSIASDELALFFQNYSFDCRNENDYLPAISGKVENLFSKAVSFKKSTDLSIEKNLDKSDRLFINAIEAGHWKAKYHFYTVKGKVFGPGSQEWGQMVTTLIDLDGKNIPIASYKLATFHELNFQLKFSLLKKAIDHGSPHAMHLVGFRLANWIEGMENMGIQMLQCAVLQGYAPAYEGLGVSKFSSKKPDFQAAQILFIRGVNSGCKDCLQYLFDFEKGKTFHTKRIDINKLYALKYFYTENSEFSDLRELLVIPPKELSLNE